MNKFYKDKESITAWLDSYNIKNYTLIPNKKYGFIVDVSGAVLLSYKNLNFIPVKFNIVDSFYCNNNNLTSLEFSPQHVNNFLCYNNLLKSLKGCPEIVNYNFLCNDNKLTSLEFFPKNVGKELDFRNNPGLGEFQNITDFKQIYSEHLKQIKNKSIKNFADRLNSSLSETIQNKKLKL